MEPFWLFYQISNFFVHSPNADFGLKIIDFGLARRLHKDGHTDVKELQVVKFSSWYSSKFCKQYVITNPFFWRSTKLSEVDFVDANMPTWILMIRMIRNVIIRPFIHILYRAPLNLLRQNWYLASLQALLQICGQIYNYLQSFIIIIIILIFV